MRAHFIGCGKLGKTIAYLLSKYAQITIDSIYCRNIENINSALQFIPQAKPCLNFSDLEPADIYFFCTPDRVIADTCQELLLLHKPKKNAIFIHFSGALSSKALCSAEKYGYEIASVHPLKSFAVPEIAINNFSGTYCAFDGSIKAFELIKRIFEKIGAILFIIPEEKKNLYHAAAVFVSNYIVSLAHIAEECFMQCKIPVNLHKPIIISLLQSAVVNLTKVEKIPEALSGPIQRGDIEIVNRHIKDLSFNEEFKTIYELLAKITMKMVGV